MRTHCSLENMFSRNRFNGQHGAAVAPKGGTKAKVHSPKKRAPNPRVALVIRGKIHRLLQGSADHHVPDSHHYSEGIEDEEEGETEEEHRSRYLKVSSRAEDYSLKVSNGKGHGGAPGPSCVGEVELNREGCIRIPCTLRHKSCRSPVKIKRISFEGDIRTAPEPMQPPPHYGPIAPDMNGTKFAGAVGSDFASPRTRPKRPFSTGDCVDYNLNRALPGTLVEEDEDKEEESSAIIEHILKELRGINKIQEEISDLRDYLTSVRGSVEEVSSCVDAVLLEIEGIRSSNKEGSGVHAGTWSGVGCKDGSSSRRRPASAYGSLGSAMPKSSTLSPQISNQRHTIHGDLLLSRAEESTVSPISESVDPHELDEPEDASDHSSDIPVGAIARKLSFGDFARPDGQEYPSTSSLSSCHSESDLEGPSSSHGRKQQRAGDGGEHWTNTRPPHGASGESAWHRETAYRRGRSLEEYVSESPLCCEGAGSWDHYRGAGGYGTSGQCSTGSSEHLSLRTRKHNNSPASSSSREEWQSRRRRPQFQSGINVPIDTNLVKPTVAYECSADLSYPQSSGYHSIDGQEGEAEEFAYGQSNDQNYTVNSHVDSYQETYLANEESSAVTWTEASLRTTEADRPFIKETGATNHIFVNQLPRSVSADVQAGGFNVKRIGRAVLDFSSALRGALRKIEVPGAQNPGGEADFETSMPSELSTANLASKPSCYEEQASGQILKGNVGDGSSAVRELSRHSTLDKSDLFSAEPMLKEANNSLTLESTETCQHPPYSDKIAIFLEELSVCPDQMSSSTSIPPPPYGLTEPPAEGPANRPADQTIKAQLSQCTTAESLTASLSVDEPSALEDQGETEVPQQPATDTVAPGGKVEGDAAEPTSEISQVDERSLKCLRTFQQILREKRESRRNLTSMTSYSQEDFEPGSHCWTSRWDLVF